MLLKSETSLVVSISAFVHPVGSWVGTRLNYWYGAIGTELLLLSSIRLVHISTLALERSHEYGMTIK